MNYLTQPGDNQIRFNLQDFISTTDRLSEILENEIESLKKLRVRDLKPVEGEKYFLTEKLETYKKLLEKKPQIVHSLSKEERDELRIKALKFGSLVNEDRKQILRSKLATEMLMDTIKSAVQDNTAKSMGYNRMGIHNDAKTSGTPYSSSVAINETI